MKKVIFCIIFLISTLSLVLINSLDSLDKKSLKNNIKYLEDNKISNIKTDENSTIIYKINKNNFVKIYPNTEIGINNGEIHLKYGILFFHDKIENKYDIATTFLLKNVWGKANYFRIKIPNSITTFNAVTKVNYLDQNLTITPTLNKLFTNENYTYYGFFIPYSPLWTDKKVEVYVELLNNKNTICKIKNSIDIESVVWQKQTIKFNETKSNELTNVDRKKYEKEKSDRYIIWNKNSENPLFKSNFSYPLQNYERVSSDFGLIREWTFSNGKVNSKDTHLGVDFPGIINGNIYAPADGIVKSAEANTEYLGNIIIIDHGHSLFTDYNHLNEMVVTVGQFVKKGEIIAKMGMTGAATGVHLHWSSRIYGVPVDPRTFLDIEDLFKDTDDLSKE